MIGAPDIHISKDSCFDRKKDVIYTLRNVLYSDRVIRIFGILKLLNIDLINLTQFTHGYRIDMLKNVLIYSKRALTVDWYIQRRQYPKKNLNTYNSL